MGYLDYFNGISERLNIGMAMWFRVKMRRGKRKIHPRTAMAGVKQPLDERGLRQ